MWKSMKFKNIAILHVRESGYRIYFLYMSKREAKKLMNNSLYKKWIIQHIIKETEM